MHAFTRRNPKLQAALAQHQATASAQARLWIHCEVRALLEAHAAASFARLSFITAPRTYDPRFAQR